MVLCFKLRNMTLYQTYSSELQELLYVFTQQFSVGKAFKTKSVTDAALKHSYCQM